MRPTALRIAALWMFLLVQSAKAQVDPARFRPVGYHPSDVAYFNTPYLSNSMAYGGEWLAFSGFAFGTPVDFNAAPGQFVNGYPQSLSPNGPSLRAILFGLNINNPDRPPEWPGHDELAKGKYRLTWSGNADVRLAGNLCSFVPGESSPSTATGSSTGGAGHRVYTCSGLPPTLEVHAIGTPAITDIKVWLPGLDNPATGEVDERFTTTLEGQFFHPLFLQRIADANWGFIRFMDWGKTNASPQRDWADRRVPNHAFQAGIINDRQPANGADGDRETGVAYEHMVALCNQTNKDLWINVPHLATADYITKLAQLIRFGSDGVNPYTTTNPNPVFAPLNANLEVYVEFSNEIWSSGFSFPQGNWAQDEAFTAGLGSDTAAKAKFTARKFCDTWKGFQTVFAGETSRLIRVAAIFTALDAYSQPFLLEMGTYGQGLSPTVRPDVLAVTTYFGNDIQGFVNSQGFTSGVEHDDPYWQSDLFDTHMHLAFEEWKRRILAGDSVAGSGPDATGTSGGFNASLRTLANDNLPYCDSESEVPCLPIIAYEGGPSIFTDSLDSGGDPPDPDYGVTIFMEAMNRDPRIADVYRIHLDLARSKGLWTHNPYTDTSPWSRFGQWGHLELLEQDPADSPKYSLMLEHFALYSTLKHIDAAVGGVPSFVTGATLPSGIAGQAYGPTTITTTGGTGARTLVVVGAQLDAGLVLSAPSADSLQISGTPITSRKNFILARVQDADGDPAWRTFTLQTFGGPGTLVQSNFNGTAPAQNRPFTQTFVLDSAKVSPWGGWDIGGGVTPLSTNDEFRIQVVGPSGDGNPAQDSSLASALTDNEFLTAAVTPAAPPLNLGGAELRFSMRRATFHAPRGFALYSSLDNFVTPPGTPLYTSSLVDKDNFDENEHIVTLPTPMSVSGTVTFRIYLFGAQFSSHPVALTGFKLTQKNPLTVTSLSSGSGPTAGGQTVIIGGIDLAGTSSVTFGGAGATIVSNTSTAVTVTTPPASAGTVTVVVTTSLGSSTLTGAYRYVAAPTIGLISPGSGTTAGGTQVAITGTNLSNAAVTFDGLSAAPISNTATSIIVAAPPHAAGAVNVEVTTAGGSATSIGGYTYAALVLSAPTGLNALAVSTSQVNLTWNAVGGATGYQIDRQSPGGSFTQIGTSATAAFSDPGRPAGTSFLYRIRATEGANWSANSSSDLATTVIFTDSPLTAGTTIKSVHVTQLRTAVNAVRLLAGQSAFSFTGTAAAGTVVSAVHVTDLRTALDAARSVLGFSTAGYTNASLTGVSPKAVHIQEVRDRVQ